jgi:hypothetical protein
MAVITRPDGQLMLTMKIRAFIKTSARKQVDNFSKQAADIASLQVETRCSREMDEK